MTIEEAAESNRWKVIKPLMALAAHFDADEMGDFQRDLEGIYDAGHAHAIEKVRGLVDKLEEIAQFTISNVDLTVPGQFTEFGTRPTVEACIARAALKEFRGEK